MNEIIKAIKERRSIRKFKPDMPKHEDRDYFSPLVIVSFMLPVL